MPRKGHSEEQIIYALRQAEAGKKVGDICREMGVSQQAFYNWKRRYAGVGVSELRELRQLREVDLPPFLTQMVKTQNPLNGELSHGVVTQAVHEGV